MTDSSVAPADERGSDEDDGDDRPGTEIEFKYSVLDVAALGTWITSGALTESGLKLSAPATVEIEDRYLDTADGRLGAGGFAARQRLENGRLGISLKGRASTGDTAHGRYQRAEIEGPANESSDPVTWPESDARTLVLRLAAGAPLRERFRIRQLRHEWRVVVPPVAPGDGTPQGADANVGADAGDAPRDTAVVPRDQADAAGEAVLSLQQVRIYRRKRMLGELDALEVELARGDEAVLHRIAALLEPTGLVEPDTTSKEEFAESLVRAFKADQDGRTDEEDGGSGGGGSGGTDDGAVAHPSDGATETAAADPGDGTITATPRIVVPKSPGVRVDDSLAEAGRKVLAMHLARMLVREEGTRSGTMEDLHKMRVATRRMRATWRTFEGAYREKRARRYVAELKAVADKLGAVRDLDVQIDGLKSYADATPLDAAALTPLADAWQRKREVAREALARLLDSNAYRRFVEDYQQFVAAPGEDAEETPTGTPTRVRDTAGGRIWTAYEHLRARHESLAWADVPTLHEVRISAKRLRYALESFREVLGPDVDGLLVRITALQDQLGELNDADLSAHLTRDYLVREGSRLPPPTVAAIGRYLAARERTVQARRRGLPPVWRQVVGLPFRRALGRCLSSL